MCCSALECGAVYCNMLQRAAVCYFRAPKIMITLIYDNSQVSALFAFSLSCENSSVLFGNSLYRLFNRALLQKRPRTLFASNPNTAMKDKNKTKTRQIHYIVSLIGLFCKKDLELYSPTLQWKTKTRQKRDKNETKVRQKHESENQTNRGSVFFKTKTPEETAQTQDKDAGVYIFFKKKLKRKRTNTRPKTRHNNVKTRQKQNKNAGVYIFFKNKTHKQKDEYTTKK